jgi:signal transduction histidine kinase/CheY-like chemotaxis protein
MRLPQLRRSFPARLFAAVFAIGAATVFLTATVSYRSAELALRERLLQQLSTAVDDDATRLSEWLAQQRAATELLAHGARATESARNGTQRAAPIPTLPPEVLSAELTQVMTVPGGRIERASDSTTVGQYAVDQLHYREAQRGTYIQPIYPGGPNGRPRLTIATPIRSDAGNVTSIVAAHLDLGEMERVLTRADSTLGVDAYLVNRFAEFVSAERFGRDGVLRGLSSVAIREALAARNGTGLYVDYAGRPVVGAWRWIPDLQLALVRETPQDFAFAPARALLLRTLLLGLVATGLLTLGIVAVTRRFTRPVIAVAQAAKAVAAGDFSATAPESGDDEVGQLARAFNVMTRRLSALYGELQAQISATTEALTEADSSRELLRDVVNNTATIVLVVGLDGVVRLANQRVSTLTSVPANATAGRSLRELLGSAGAPLANVIELARSSTLLVEQEVELVSPLGPHAWQVVAFPLVHADGTPYATGLIATDLTERARAEAERRAQDASVQQAQKLESLGVMAGGIAHDFNNLLGAILGNAELAREATDDSARTNDVRHSLDQISAAGRRAAELTRQMLAYAGRASLRRDVVDIRVLVHDIVPLVRASQPKKVEFLVEDMPTPLWVELDPAQLSQVLLNLLTNAAEAIGAASGTVALRVETVDARVGFTSSADVRPNIRIVVEDTGPGIPDDMRERIFDPFFSTKGSGRGLGLSAVRGIVQSLGGELHVHSLLGVGTRFEIVMRGAEAPEVDELPSVISDAAAVRGTVLVIDDEAAMRHIAHRIVTQMGLEVLEAEDGAQGIALFASRSHDVSLVLLDLTMPKMGGEEVLARIRATHATLPVIVASGYDHADALARMPQDECTSFLQKPFGVQALRDAVGAALGSAVAA